MNKHYFDKQLGKKVLYKTPLYLVDLKLKPEIKNNIKKNKKEGGSDRNKLFEYRSLNDDNTRLLFMNYLHNAFTYAVLILRQIYLNRQIDYNKLREYNEIKYNKTNMDKVAMSILKCKNIIYHPFLWIKGDSLKTEAKYLYNTHVQNKCIIIRIYDAQHDFLQKWKEFIYNITSKLIFYHPADVIKTKMIDAGFKLKNKHTPRTSNGEVKLLYLMFSKN